MKKGLVIIGHGSRSQDAVCVFQQVVDWVKNTDEFDTVKGAFMELSPPSVPEVIEQVIREEVKKIVVVPYFLYEGIHIKEDIPELIKEASEQFPDVEFKMAKPIGAEPVLAQILLERARAAE